MASSLTDKVISPKIIGELAKRDESEYDIIEERLPDSPAMKRYNTLTPDDRLMLKALEIALDAADMIGEEEVEHPFVPEPEPVPVVIESAEEEETEQASAESAADDLPDSLSDENLPQTADKAPVKVKITESGRSREVKQIKVKVKTDGEGEDAPKDAQDVAPVKVKIDLKPPKKTIRHIEVKVKSNGENNETSSQDS